MIRFDSGFMIRLLRFTITTLKMPCSLLVKSRQPLDCRAFHGERERQTCVIMVVRLNTVFGWVELWQRPQTRTLLPHILFSFAKRDFYDPSPPPGAFWPTFVFSETENTGIQGFSAFISIQIEVTNTRHHNLYNACRSLSEEMKAPRCRFWKYKRFHMSHKSTSYLCDCLLRFQLHILRCQFIYSFTVKSFTQGEPAVGFPLPSFPGKLLGFIMLALKARMVETTCSISLFNLQKGFPSSESVSRNEAIFLHPLEECLMKQTCQHEDSQTLPCEIGLYVRETGQKTNVRSMKSGHQNQTRRLAQRFC